MSCGRRGAGPGVMTHRALPRSAAMIPTAIYPLDDVVPRVLNRREAPRVGARRRAVQRRGGTAIEKLVWTLLVVEDAEASEGALLGGQIRRRRPCRRGLEGPRHPVVGAVVLGMSGQDPLMLNAQPDPPDVELRQAVNARGGKRHPVVRPDRGRQPVLAKEALEDGPPPVAWVASSPGQPSR